MICSGCGHENRPTAKFCEECATPLQRLCASCGCELRPSARFCDECAAPIAATGTPRAAPAATLDIRKVVTIVFADLVGSTALHERLDAESARRFMDGYYAAMRAAVEAHGGAVTQLLGDGVKAVFGIPRVAEDDALRAVRAAVAMQEAFRALAAQQRGAVGKTGLRVAVNTGEVVANDADEIIGDPVNVAARLQEQGRDGDVVVGGSTNRLVAAHVTLEPLGNLALKGRSEAVKAYRVVSLDAPASAATAAFVGRDAEFARLGAVYATAVEKPAACLGVVLGSPGLGKSRLISEFAHRLGGNATVVAAHCDAAGGASFAPLAEALRELLGLEAGAGAEAVRAAVEPALPGEPAERARIGAGIAALLTGSPASPEETFFVVRRLLAALAAANPVLLVIDDLQWAEPLLLDLVEHLVQWGSGVPLLVLVGARPELRDLRSSLGTPGGLVSDVVTLAGLDAGAAMRLAANVIGAADLPAAVAAKVLAASEGNPLFVGELVRMLVDEGALTRKGERWTAGTALAALEMPPTIHALLAARIERMRPEERSVLERAAVVGRHFSRGAVAELLPGDASDLDARLEALRRSELIERDTGWFLGEPMLRFHHTLIRDAAYRRLLKGTRAELHTRFADWVEARAGHSVEHDEMVGWHLEQTHQLLRELGPLDAAGQALGARASKALAAAGQRALDRDDLPLAAGLLGRALACLDPLDPARGELAIDWCDALLAVGNVAAAAAAIDEIGRFTEDSERLRAWHICFVGQHTVLTAPRALDATAAAVAAAAETLTALGDTAGEAKAHFVTALALSRLGKVGPCEAALDLALAAARRAGDRRRANTVLALAPLAALWGPSPVTRASGRCLDVVRVLRITQGAPAVEAVALSCQGVLEALRGRSDAARRMIASARKLVEELGISQRLFEADAFAGLVDLLEGDAPGAERWLRGAYEGLRDLGLGIDAARAAALLARALLAQDRVAEAEELSHASESLAGDDLKAAIAWRGVRAEALARRGETLAAVELASQAVEIAAATDAPLDHADARLALAAALRAAGRLAEGDAEERRARELWEAKGAVLLAERAARDGAIPPTVHPEAAGTVGPRRPSRRGVSTNARSPDLANTDEPVNIAAPLVPGHVRPNAVTHLLQRLEAAFDARDVEAYAALFSDSFEAIDHATGSCLGADTLGRSIQRMFRSQDPQLRHDVLATFGPSLALVRRTGSASGTRAGGFDTGPLERVDFSIHATDARGLFHRSEVFAADRLARAVARFYEFHAEAQPAGPQRERAAATARSVAEFTDPAPQGNPGAAARAWFSPTVGFADHRTLSLPSGSGAEDMLRIEGSLHDLAHHFAGRTDAVLRLEPSAALLGMTLAGLRRDGGGAFEFVYLALAGFDGDGRCDRYESFDVDDQAEARARFEALFGGVPRDSGGHPLPACFATPGVRLSRAIFDAFLARDWERYARSLAPGFRYFDRRRISHLELDRADYIAFSREIGDLDSTRGDHRILATRGDRLVLAGLRFDLSGGAVGASEIEYLTVEESDDDGAATVFIRFDSDDLDAAIAELDARYQADRSAAHVDLTLGFSTAVAAGDWDTVAGLCSSGFVEYDHRPLAVLGTTHGAKAWVQNFRTLVALAPDTTARFDHIREGARGILWQLSWRGTREGGDYEIPLCGVLERSEPRRFSRVDIYDPEQLVEAAARFDELAAAGPPGAPFENSATHATQQMVEFWRVRDWPAFAGAIAADFRYLDRRGLAQLDLDRDQYVEFTRQLGDLDSTQIEREVLATRGDRLALIRIRMRLAGGEVGPSELEFLDLNELDERGLQRTFIRFDPENREAATAELHARFEAGEGATHARTLRAMRVVGEAWANRDWEVLIASCAPGFANRDHRQLGFGMTLHNAAAWARSQQVLVELAPDSRTRMDHLRLSRHGYLRQLTQYGTRDGGAFETPFLSVGAVDALGRAAGFDIYDLDKFEEARAHFEGLGRAAAAPSPFANTASRAMDHTAAAWNARDWPRFTGIFAPVYRNIDRRRRSQLELDRDRFVAFTRQLGDMDSARQEWRLLATRGERLALAAYRIQVSGGPVGPSVLEFLNVFETDADGEVTAGFQFDADALEAAYAELDRRFDAGEGAAHPYARASTRLGYVARAAAGTPAFAAFFTLDFVYHDHRLLGWGEVARDVGMFGRVIQSLFEVAPDALYQEDHLRVSEFGYWGLICAKGTREGGAFENAFLRVCQVDEHGLVERLDSYDVEAIDEARARFEGLGTNAVRDPLRVPPNAATRASARLFALAAAGAWDAAAALCDTIAFEDRRPAPGTGSGSFVARLKTAFDAGLRPQCRALALGGENAALLHLEWTPRAGGAGAASQSLEVVEVDGAGRIAACVVFDPGDRSAAQKEVSDRIAAPDRVPASVMEFRNAANDHDVARLRAAIPDNFVFHDHRLAGLGRIAGAAGYLASVTAYWELSPDVRLDELFLIASAPHGRVAVGRTSGSNTEGGAFESLYVSIIHHPDGQMSGIELFEPEDRATALSRFEECGRARNPG